MSYNIKVKFKDEKKPDDKSKKTGEKPIKVKTTGEMKTPLAIEKEYLSKLKKLSKEANNSLQYWLGARLKQTAGVNSATQLKFEFSSLYKQWLKHFTKEGKKISKEVTQNSVKYVNSKFKAENENFNLTKQNEAIANQVKAIYENNLALIKSIPQDIINRYQKVLFENVNNFDIETLKKTFQEIGKISERQAELIAKDQVHKAVNSYQRVRAQQLGFLFYKWITAGDERVSKGAGGHKELEGRLFRFDEASAIIDKYGTKGHPGQRYNCRCTQVSVYIENGQEVEFITDAEHGDYYQIIE